MPKDQYKLAYRIAVVRNGHAEGLNGLPLDMHQGVEHNFPNGLLLATNKGALDYLDFPGAPQEQYLLYYRFLAKDLLKGQTRSGEIRVKRATLIHADRLKLETGPLAERLTFDQLLRVSEPKRVLRAETVRGPALDINSTTDSNYWWFNFKSFPSTTGLRHKGYIQFFKPKGMIDPKEYRKLETIPCLVDCSCQDWKFRFAWLAKQKGSSRVGPSSLNQAINRAPRKSNPDGRISLCKHLIALRDYIYGSAYAMEGDADVTPRMDRLTKEMTHRWINIHSEMAKARERERQYRQGVINQRRSPERAPAAPVELPSRETPTDVEADVEGSTLDQLKKAIQKEVQNEPAPDSAPPAVPLPTDKGSDSEFRSIGDSIYPQQPHFRMPKNQALISARKTLNTLIKESEEFEMEARDDGAPAPEAETGLEVLCDIRDILANIEDEGDTETEELGDVDDEGEEETEELTKLDDEDEEADQFRGEEMD